jgi:hypothetical protein
VSDLTHTPVSDLRHNTRRMLQALDAYWLHYDGLPKPPRGRYDQEDWWHRFTQYRKLVEDELRAARGTR